MASCAFLLFKSLKGIPPDKKRGGRASPPHDSFGFYFARRMSNSSGLCAAAPAS